MTENIDTITISNNWLMSLDGIQKLGLALITPFIALLTYSFLQIVQVQQFQNELLLKSEKASDIGNILKQEMPHIETIKRILEDSGKRILLVNTADFRENPTIKKTQLNAWKVRILTMRSTIQLDRGRVEQFTSESYPFLKESASTLAELLDKEDAMWMALLKFLELQADPIKSLSDRETQFQLFTNRMLTLGHATGRHTAAILKSVDDLTNSERHSSQEFKQLLSESQSNIRSFRLFIVLFFLGALGTIFCAASIIGLRKKNK